MRNLKRLSLTDDDPTIPVGNVENTTSDAENGEKLFFFLFLYFSFYLDDE